VPFLLWANCNLEGNSNSKCDFEKSSQEFKTIGGSEFEKNWLVKIEIEKVESILNWEKFKD